jgi:hypothetical protein
MKWEDVMSALVRFAAAAMLMFGHASHVQAEPQHCADSPAWGSSRIGQAISALSPADGICNAYVGTAVAQPSPVERNAGNIVDLEADWRALVAKLDALTPTPPFCGCLWSHT